MWNLVPVALLGIVGLGMSFAIALWWGAAAFAVFNLVTTAYFVFAVIGACGLQYAVLRAIAEQPDDRDRVAAVVAGALVPGLALAAAATAGFIAIHPLVARWLASPAAGEGMLWAAPGLFCFAINKLLFGVVNGLRRMRAFAVYTSLRYLLLAAALAIAVRCDLAPAHLPAIWTFTEAILLAVLTVELLATVPLRRATGWTTWTRRHLTYGVRGVAATLAYEINTKLDVWMLGVLTADKYAVGVYALAAALHEGVTQLAVVLQNNLDPTLAHLAAPAAPATPATAIASAPDRRPRTHAPTGHPAELLALIARTRRWFVPAMVGACIASAAMFPAVIPRLVGDPGFATGTLPFAILMTGIALASPYLPFGHLLLMAQRPGWHTVLIVTAVAINALGNLILVPRLGLTGAATAMAATVVATALLLRGLSRHQLGIRL
ncbi:MAG TPA: polysaccharide biosynthesis C-terminal domain-containing protein [Kofleriaceae bacterium]|nr:polysaccharide biosynthesis C-terminal domain-containing protein [Kofleriaceae bacterium]